MNSESEHNADSGDLEARYRKTLESVKAKFRKKGLLVFIDSIRLVVSIPAESARKENGERTELKSAFRLFLVRVANDTKPYLILDDTDTITEDTSGTLYISPFDHVNVEESPAVQWLAKHFRDDDWLDLRRSLLQLGRRFEESKGLVSYVSDHLYRPVVVLDTIDFIHERGFMERFVRDLVEFKATKDPAIALAFKAATLEGVEMSANPHALIVTNAFTGKTEPFRFSGKVLDRVTSKALIGAYRQDGLSSGALSNYNRAVVIEQIEEQDAPSLLAFLFNLLESGEARQEIGGYKRFVHSKAVIVITGNPLLETDRSGEGYANAFNTMLLHLSMNRALGRRFGLVLYGTEYKPVLKSGPGLDNSFAREQYATLWQILREIERRCKDNVVSVFAKPEVVEWLNKIDGQYVDKVTQMTSVLGDKFPLLYGFLIDHSVYGQKHIRGGALNCAILDTLPDIESGAWDIQGLLSKADDYLERLVTNNLASVARLVLAGQEHSAAMRGIVLTRLPTPLQQVVLAGMGYKKAYSRDKTVTLEALECYRLDKDALYWSKTVNDCLALKLERYEEALLQYFGIKIDKLQRRMSFAY